MVSTRPPNSKSSSPFDNPFDTVPKAPITTGMIVIFMFHSFFNSLARSMKWILLFTFFQFYSVVSRDSKVDNFASSLFLGGGWLLLSVVFWPGLVDPCVCQSTIGVYGCHFRGQALGYAYTICYYGRIEISCTFPSGTPCRPSRVSPYTPVLICCIRYTPYYYYDYYYYTPCDFFPFVIFDYIFSITDIYPAKPFVLIIFLFLEFFTPTLAHGFPLEFERQQVPSSLKDSFQYSSRSQ